MEITEKTRRELERRLDELENFIAEKGIGSEYLQRAERAQRDLNLALAIGSAAVVLGAVAWSIYQLKD